MARRQRLTDAGIARLRPEAREYTVWDTRVPGLGVRVRPCGSRTYVRQRPTSAGVKRASLGATALRGVEEARRACRESDTSTDEARPTDRSDTPLFRHFVAGPWETACCARWKPSSRSRARSALNHQLLPAFGALRLDRISRLIVARWFERYSRTAPGGANRALDVLRQILNHAIACGHIETNPACAIARNRTRARTRFLSRDEIRRLHQALERHAQRSESARAQADIIRLLLLTGCRKNEIVRLRWQEVGTDRLSLSDSKTGPRHVFLNAQARAVIERRKDGSTGDWVFPSVRNPAGPQSDMIPLWYTVRREAGIEDVRLHDLRHSVATHAVMQGVPLPIVARILGHRHPGMTLRYAHVGDSEVEAAAERVGQVIARLLAPENIG